MAFFESAIGVLQTLVIALGAGLGRNYVDVVKTVNKAPQTQAKAAEEVVKKTAPAAPATVVNAAASAEPKGAAMEGQKEEEAVSSKIKDAVDKVNQKIVPSKTRCEFSYHEDTNRISIKVIDQAIVRRHLVRNMHLQKRKKKIYLEHRINLKY